MPFWVDPKGNKVSIAGRWDDGHTKNAAAGHFPSFDKVEKAYNDMHTEKRVIWYE